MLNEHVLKGDPVDIANFAMMLHQRGGRTSTALTPSTLQARVWEHCEAVCEGDPTDLDERRDRFTEEALDLIQACGGTLDGVAALARYVFGRAVGQRRQEFGGTTTTLASLASMAGEDLLACGEAELARTWEPDTFARIRRKRAARHGRGPLPGVDGDLVTSPASPLGVEIVALRDLARVLDAHLGDGALSDHGYDLVTAALARVYPEHVHTVERCGEPSCREHGCDECPTDAQRQAADNRLTAWLARNPCQGPTPSPVADGAAPFLESQDGDPLQLDETRPVATSALPQVVSPSTGSGRAGA
ncbi:hypothetical protein [uncultured Methylobacterium sp.]|jgi:hypothetical protein|uniref:hypothetical protein n=1 Tax=uncultured Methylobacterium sp. TaxID=157278 RepID=UPI0026340C2C|nr:hypothetical protein [uncultured Methylobacterium sp.]